MRRLKRKILTFFFNQWFRKHPPEMVHYWQWSNDQVMCLVGKDKNGSYQMEITGEKYKYLGFPRGHLLLGTLSPLKHNIKNQIFNYAWYALEEGKSPEEVIRHIKETAIPNIIKLGEVSRYNMIPFNRMCRSVKAIWLGWTKVEEELEGTKRETVKRLKEIMCYILQEDDAYRFRVQWLVNYFNPTSIIGKLWSNNLDDFKYALETLEHAEMIGDMKERIRLLKRILLLLLSDQTIKDLFIKLYKSVDWNKVKLTKADKYYFRGKYFKVDFDKFDY